MVVITFRTITQLSFTLDLEPYTTVADVKTKIAAEKGDEFAIELQKLIYDGKILPDTATIESAGIDSNKFVVVMLTRKKTATSEVLPTSTSVDTHTTPTSATSVTPPAPATVPNNPTSSAINKTRTEAPPDTTESLSAEQKLLMENIIAMGYTDDQATTALRLAEWNGDRAVDLLLSGGIDETAFGTAAVSTEEEGANPLNSLDELEGMPQMAELREFVRGNPGALPALMQQIAQINPGLMAMIAQNQEGFLRMLSEEDEHAAPAGEAGATEGAQVQRDGNRVVVSLSEEESAAIRRIKSMGFRVSDSFILEAYLACDKNEELAINYIMNNMDQEDGQD